jgi:hypothetical protein
MGPSTPDNCVHRIAFSMLREEGARASFRLHFRCAFVPPEGTSHLDHANRLLHEAGLSSPDDLRGLPGLPRTALLCLPIGAPAAPPACGDPLLAAAILGLCNNSFYSPSRPVLWTEKRLARRFELHALAAFYED